MSETGIWQEGDAGVERPHVLVVDDDTRLSDLLSRFLGGHGFVVTAAASAEAARASLAGITVDVIVLDIMMPGESGLDMARDLSGRPGMPPILLLSARGEVADRVAGLEVGAEDYLAKPFEPRELLLRLRTILKRRVVTDTRKSEPAFARYVRFGPLTFDCERQELRRGSDLVRLTPGEAALLNVLATKGGGGSGPGGPGGPGGDGGEAMSRELLSEAAGIAGGERTVDVHVTRLRRKIEPDPAYPRYLQTVRGRGYRLLPD